jgi:hypothetical protein
LHFHGKEPTLIPLQRPLLTAMPSPNFDRRLLPAALCLLTACAGGPTPSKDPAIEQEFARRKAEAEKAAARDTYERALIHLDQSLDKYVQAKFGAGNPNADQLSASLEKWIGNTVDKYFDRLLHSAVDASIPGNRAIAIAALGFSKRAEALDPLLNGLTDKDSTIVGNAALGLGVLADPRTPPAALAAIVEDDRQQDLARISASRALLMLQQAGYGVDQIAPVWLRILSLPHDKNDPAILVHSLRGVGLLRKPEFAKQVEPYASHPTPLVRQAAAIALGRLGSADSHVALLALIGPAETNANVRLAARKALEALAGGVSRGYDVEGWRKVFQRG